jgi:glucose-6-phosphate isomerase
VPVILALLGVWYSNFYKSETQTLLPYDQVSYNIKIGFLHGTLVSATNKTDSDSYRMAVTIVDTLNQNEEHSEYFYSFMSQWFMSLSCSFTSIFFLTDHSHNGLATTGK